MLISRRLSAVHVEFTSRCNLRCVFCFASQPEYVGTDLDAATLAGLMRELAQAEVDVISANGHGETTIYPDWHLYADRLLEAGKALHITSNFAKPFSEEEIHTLSRFKSIEISCDTADPALFSRLRRGARLETVVRNLKEVQASIPPGRRAPEISFSCVVSDANVFDLETLAAFGKSLGVGHFNFCNLTRYPDVEAGLNVDHVTEMGLESMRRARRSIADTCRYLEEEGIRFDIQAGLLDSLDERIRQAGGGFYEEEKKQGGGEPLPPGPRRYSTRREGRITRDCLDPWSFILVNSRREVLPCCWHHPVGNLGFGQSLMDVFNSPLTQVLRHRLLTGDLPLDCRECPSRGWTTPGRLRNRVRRYLHPLMGRIWPFGVRARHHQIVPRIQYKVTYDKGWYDLEENPGIPEEDWRSWRWTNRRAEFSIPNPNRGFALVIRGSVDKTKFSNQSVSIRVENELLDSFVPQSARFHREYLLPSTMAGTGDVTAFRIETNRVFVPALTEPGSSDQRELGLQVYELFLGRRDLG